MSPLRLRIRHTVAADGTLSTFQDNCVDDVASESGHAPPPSLVARTMSCDIRELCGELTHLVRSQFAILSCESIATAAFEFENRRGWEFENAVISICSRPLA